MGRIIGIFVGVFGRFFFIGTFDGGVRNARFAPGASSSWNAFEIEVDREQHAIDDEVTNEQEEGDRWRKDEAHRSEQDEPDEDESDIAFCLFAFERFVFDVGHHEQADGDGDDA